MSIESSMMDELHALRSRLEVLERSRATLRRRVRNTAIGLAVALASVSGVAVAADGMCPNDYPFCFTANQPAIASQVNHNFDQIREWVEQKVGATGTANVTLTGATTATSIAASGAVSAQSFATPGNVSASSANVAGGVAIGGDVYVPNNTSAITYTSPAFNRNTCGGATGASCPSGQYVCGIISSHICGQDWFTTNWTIQCCGL